MGEGADLGGREAGAPLAEGALDVADEVRYLEIFGDVRRCWECFFYFFWRCLEVFGKDLVIWCWFLWVYSGVDCEEKVWLEVGRFGRYSWVLPGMVAVFGGVQVLDFIVGDVVGERPGGNSASVSFRSTGSTC